MPPKAKSSKDKKAEPAKVDKLKKPTDDTKKLKAANAVKVRHVLCEKHSKGKSIPLATHSDNRVLEAMAKLKEVLLPKGI